MARKWSNLNLPGALHYVTGNFLDPFQSLQILNAVRFSLMSCKPSIAIGPAS